MRLEHACAGLCNDLITPINRNGASRRYSAGDEELKLPFTYTIVLFLNHAVFVIVSVIFVVSILNMRVMRCTASRG